MSYIGRGTENISNVEVLDNLTFNGSASYTLQKSSTNFVPSSANNLLISISGVVQQGNFSVSGSTITFDTTVSASDTCDWILHYGTGLITTVADGAITEAKLGRNAVTTAKITDGTITNAKLQNSSITLNGSAVSLGGSATVGGSNTPFFQAGIGSTQSIANSTATKIAFNSEDFDTDNCYDSSTNYRFTPTEAGKYYVYIDLGINSAQDSKLALTYVYIYKNGSVVETTHNRYSGGNQHYATVHISSIVELNGTTDYIEAYGEATHVDSSNLSIVSGNRSRFGAYKLIGA